MFPDGQVCVYRVPTVKMELYTKDSIFEKNLLMLLPFYVMRYENVADIFAKDSEKLQGLLMEYEDIRIKLEREFSITGRAGMYTDLNKLIIRISDYIFRKEEKVRKGVGEVMGGKVLQLESERLREEGMAIGEVRGKAEGIVQGIRFIKKCRWGVTPPADLCVLRWWRIRSVFWYGRTAGVR